LVRQVLGVLVVFALLGAAMWLLRRNPADGIRNLIRKKSGRLESVERLALGPQHALHLVRFEGRVLLIAAHPGGCTLLETASWREDGASAPAAAGMR
ncbi:MAG TPA: flagellar biosynthetic protein FliO, partial [Bryobacteraceae bacterium]